MKFVFLPCTSALSFRGFAILLEVRCHNSSTPLLLKLAAACSCCSTRLMRVFFNLCASQCSILVFIVCAVCFSRSFVTCRWPNRETIHFLVLLDHNSFVVVPSCL